MHSTIPPNHPEAPMILFNAGEMHDSVCKEIDRSDQKNRNTQMIILNSIRLCFYDFRFFNKVLIML